MTKETKQFLIKISQRREHNRKADRRSNIEQLEGLKAKTHRDSVGEALKKVPNLKNARP